MKKNIYRFASGLVLVFCTVSTVFSFGGGNSLPTSDNVEPVISGEMKTLTISVRKEGSNEILEVPLFSEKYAQLPVASVDGEPITLKQFTMELATMHGSMSDSETPGSRSLTKMLDRMITIRLVKQEALNIGFDRTPAVQEKIENFALTTMIQKLLADQIENIKVTEDETDELYQQMAIEAKLLSYSFAEQADAEAVHAEAQAGASFRELGDKIVANGKAEKSEEPEYIRLTELLPAIAKAVFTMEKGSVSEIFKNDKGYLIFQLEDKRVYEDPDVRLAAASQLIQKKSAMVQKEYLESLVEKYATFNEEAEAALDFAKISEENPQIKGTEVFSRLSKDKRPLVTITDGQETVVITVAEMAKKVEGSMYHGIDKVIDGDALNRSKETKIWNSLVAVAGKMEAEAQGIDQSASFKEKVQNYETEVLFDTFMGKAVMPGIKVPEKEAQEYYFRHLEEYASPLMLKMKSLPFSEENAAREALKKLQSGSDFKWISANSTGLADSDNKDILSLGGVLLAETALPEELQAKVKGAKQGDIFYYEGPGNLYYLLLVDTAFPPKAKPYEEAREEIGKIIYAQKIKEALDEWVIKLKEAYETKIFIVES